MNQRIGFSLEKLVRYGQYLTLIIIFYFGSSLIGSSQETEPSLLSDKSDHETNVYLDHIEEDLGRITSLVVYIEQEKHLAIFDAPVMSTGQLIFKAPSAVRFEIVEPFQSVLVVSGTESAKYEGFDGDWKKMRLGNPEILLLVMKQISLWLQGKFRENDDVFTISVEEANGKTIVLRPRLSRFQAFIASIELSFDEDLRRFTSMNIREPEGDYTLLRFVKEWRGIAVSSKIFDIDRASPAAMSLPVEVTEN